jgi:peptide/nickel transport system substrate-binding protein
LSSMRTGAKVLATLAAASLALSACASDDGGEDDGSSSQETTAPITVTWGYAQEFASYNGNTADGNSVANNAILGMTAPSFWYFAPNGDVTPDKDFGSFEKTSDNPLTVKYTFNEKAVWSDGEPIDCDDFVMGWLANSGVSGEEGGFSAAATFGYEDQNKPACADGDKVVTVTYKKPFADWAGLYGSPVILPAHVVEKNAGVADLIAAADEPTGADSKKLAQFYNEGFNTNPGTIKPDVFLSSGRYKLTQWQAGQSLTLEANDKWWGAPPKSKTIVVRYIGDDQQAQALQNGEIDFMDPQPQVEIVNQLKALGDKVNFSTHDQFTFEHLDFNFRGDFKDRNLREAFAKCVPRQQIIDNLIKPQNENAQIQTSRYVYPFQDSYGEFANVGSEKYNATDIPGAKALVDAAGKSGMTVRIGWRKDPAALNKRRADTLALVAASCKQAGFNVVDNGTPDFFEKDLPTGNFDVAMYAWSGSPLVTGSSAIYITKGGSNYQAYSNPQVDQLTAQLNGEIDTAKQVDLMKQIDTTLWTDLTTIPLFAFPGILATVPEAENVEYNATQQELAWNAHQWSLKQ